MKYFLYVILPVLSIHCRSSHLQQTGGEKNIISINIGKQVWSSENLDVLTFRNGDSIPHVKTSADWERAGIEGKPAWCYYQGDSGEVKAFGRMYNWFAINDARGLAPAGWHVATNDDWIALEEFVGVEQAGVFFKNDSIWTNGNTQPGTGILLGGYRGRDGRFTGMGEFTYMASSSESDVKDTRGEGMAVWGRGVHVENKDVMRCALDKQFGLYVRCVKDK